MVSQKINFVSLCPYTGYFLKQSKTAAVNANKSIGWLFEQNYTLHIHVAELLIVLLNSFDQNDNKQGLTQAGVGGAMGVSAPPSRRKGPLNLRGRVKMNLRMQKKWTSTTWSFKISGKMYPRIPPSRSCFRCSHPPKQNPAYSPS